MEPKIHSVIKGHIEEESITVVNLAQYQQTRLQQDHRLVHSIQSELFSSGYFSIYEKLTNKVGNAQNILFSDLSDLRLPKFKLRIDEESSR